ncbi:hypothetical protein HGB07_05695 [Candidatus Roizmanbacteria bacterium]|nr:hypothetical protein [Candidatus Roizmanbacteria bacterium]
MTTRPLQLTPAVSPTARRGMGTILIPGGVAIVTSPELFSKLVVKELETKEGIVIDAGEVTSKLSKSAEVGFLVSPEALHKGHTLPADIKITVVQNTTGMISALQHEVYSEMAGELIAEGTKTTETLKRLQESHPVSAFLKRALFDLSARLEENGRVENFGDLSVTEEMKKKHPDDADIKPK